MIPTDTLVNRLRDYAMSSEFHLRRIMLEAANRLELKHGRWIVGTGENALMLGYRMCSECGEIIKTQYSLYGMFNYCPNCGAKMDGETDGKGKAAD